MAYDDNTPLTPLQNLFNAIETTLSGQITDLITTRQIKTYKWANAAARGSQTGMVEGDTGDQADNNTQWRYDGAAWRCTTSGDIIIIPTGVVNGTVGAGGLVTFNNVSSVSFNGVFTSEFDNYVIEISLFDNSSLSFVNFTLRNAGVDRTGSDYYTQLLWSTSATASGQSILGFQRAQLGFILANQEDITLKVKAPAIARPTSFKAEIMQNVVASGLTAAGISQGRHASSLTSDGFSILRAGGTMYGTVRVIGLN